MTNTYRTGPVGALMDEYERAVGELIRVLEPLADDDYERICDTDTKDEDCRSVQTIMTHVVRAGFGYAGMLRDAWGIERVVRSSDPLPRAAVATALRGMLDYMIETLGGKWSMSEEEATSMEIRARWGPVYDFEQLFEHAIVHILRHRRQIERFLKR
jgi:hypothetical protein